jgi:hypothetical protein
MGKREALKKWTVHLPALRGSLEKAAQAAAETVFILNRITSGSGKIVRACALTSSG